MKILCVYDGSGPKLHRCLLPCAGMEKTYKVEIKVVNHLPSYSEDDIFNGIDIVLFNRMIAGVNRERLLMWREKYGFKLVCDLDDHWVLDRDHLLYEGYRQHMITTIIEWYIKHSDLILVTHERLHRDVIEINKNCYILPNAIPKFDQFLVKKIPDDYVRLFWAGGVTHRKDLELLRRALKLIKRDGVKLIMGGYEDNPEWKEMAKIFTTDSTYNTQVIRSQPPTTYYTVYSLCDISLIPLVQSKFNEHKSNLKILEAANIEAPVVVSRVHPYVGFPDSIVSYVDSHRPWYSQITKLIKDPILRKEQGIELRNYCDIHYSFNKINQMRYELLQHETGQRREVREAPAKAEPVD